MGTNGKAVRELEEANVTCLAYIFVSVCCIVCRHSAFTVRICMFVCFRSRGHRSTEYATSTAILDISRYLRVEIL